jgi:hypothetical protein
VHPPKGRIVFDQLASRSVEPVHDHLIDALIGHEHALATRIERDVVGVWTLLCRARSGAGVLADLSGGSQTATIVDRKHCHAAVLVIGHQKHTAGRIYTQVARFAATCWLTAERG